MAQTTTLSSSTQEKAAPSFISFNQDAGCFAVGSDQGFRIYNVEPFQEMFHRDFASGGIGIVEMLFRSNILALVGGGLNPRLVFVCAWFSKAQVKCLTTTTT